MNIIEELQESIAADVNAQLRGKTVEVLVEGIRRGKAYGRDRNDKLVYFDGSRNLFGKLIDIKIEKTGPWSLYGTSVETVPSDQRN